MARRARSVVPLLEPCEERALLTSVVPNAALPGAVVGVTDPSIIQLGNEFFVFSSGPGIAIRESPDLIHWSVIGRVFASDVPLWASAAVPGASTIWAPDVSYFDGEFHVYYAVSTYGGQQSVIGLATNRTLDPTDPAYHWVDHGLVVASRPGAAFNAIDPNIFQHSDGQVWLTFGSRWSGIQQLALDPATGLPLATSPMTIASRPGGGTIEAPFLSARGGWYYLFTSFGNAAGGVHSNYEVTVGRSRSPNGPFVDRSGRPLLLGGGTVVLAGSGRWRGPGSNGILAAGGVDWMVIQTADARNHGVETLQVRPLMWTPSGWPVAGAPLP